MTVDTLSGGLVVSDLRSKPGYIRKQGTIEQVQQEAYWHRSDIEVVAAITAAISTVHATEHYHTLPKLNLKQVKHHIYDAESYIMLRVVTPQEKTRSKKSHPVLCPTSTYTSISTPACRAYFYS